MNTRASSNAQEIRTVRINHQEIYLECKKHGIEFMSTPFDNQSFDILKNIELRE